ncbi:TPA: hypothetical protein ACKRLB_003381 [Proteus mirabilis]|uniref:hypothetical protein n=1 Tax=Proteus mirabilis TaxID=584 RepID=UPI000A8DF1A5|nr:hypothetical protein [Proteus mirabilis]
MLIIAPAPLPAVIISITMMCWVNITRTELPHQRAFEYLYYGSGHLQQTQW